jgi:hypothetical protein
MPTKIKIELDLTETEMQQLAEVSKATGLSLDQIAAIAMSRLRVEAEAYKEKNDFAEARS